MSGTAIFLLCLVWIIGGGITGKIAEKQGRPFFTWFIAGMAGFIIAFLYLLFSKPSDDTLIESGKYRKCPQCAEVIKADAKVCRYCGKELPAIVDEEIDEADEVVADDSDDKLASRFGKFIAIAGSIFWAVIVVSIVIHFI